MDEVALAVRENALKHAPTSTESTPPRKNKKKQIARATIDPTGGARLDMIREEAAHRRAQEDKRLELVERRIAVAEANAESNQELIPALLAKFG